MSVTAIAAESGTRRGDGSSPEELRAWVASILEREQTAKIFGTLTISLEAGRIVRIETKRSERPPG